PLHHGVADPRHARRRQARRHRDADADGAHGKGLVKQSVAPPDRLLNSVPLTARRVFEIGCGDGAKSYRRRNPRAAYVGLERDQRLAASARRWLDEVLIGEAAEFDLSTAATRGPFDLVILPAMSAADLSAVLPRISVLLADGGYVLAQLPAATPKSIAAGFTALGFPVRRIKSPEDLGASGPHCTVCLQKSAPAAWRELHIRVGAFVPDLMEVRARLPAEALRADPCLSVDYQAAPVYLPPAPREKPKILLLQRPRLPNLDAWRNIAAT